MVHNAHFHLFFVGALLTELRLASRKDKVSISLVRETMYRYEFIQKERAVVAEWERELMNRASGAGENKWMRNKLCQSKQTHWQRMSSTQQRREREGEAAHKNTIMLAGCYAMSPNLTHAGCGLHTHCPKVDTEMSQTQQNNKKTRKYRQKAVSLYINTPPHTCFGS